MIHDVFHCFVSFYVYCILKETEEFLYKFISLTIILLDFLAYKSINNKQEYTFMKQNI